MTGPEKFAGREWNLDDDEIKELQQYASDRGLTVIEKFSYDEIEWNLCLGWTDAASNHYFPGQTEVEFFGDLLSSPSPMKVYHPLAGYLKRGLEYIEARTPGWAENEPLYESFNARYWHLDGASKDALLLEHLKATGENQQRSSTSHLAKYTDEAKRVLDKKTSLIHKDHLAELAIRTSWFERQLELCGELLQQDYEPDLLNWFKVVYALATEWSQEAAEYCALIKVNLYLGGTVSLLSEMVFDWLEGETLPDCALLAQTDEFIRLVVSREWHIRWALHLSDELNITSHLLRFAVKKQNPLSDQALAEVMVYPVHVERDSRKVGNPNFRPLKPQTVRAIGDLYDQLMSEDEGGYSAVRGEVSEAMKVAVAEELGIPESTAAKYLRKHVRDNRS